MRIHCPECGVSQLVPPSREPCICLFCSAELSVEHRAAASMTATPGSPAKRRLFGHYGCTPLALVVLVGLLIGAAAAFLELSRKGASAPPPSSAVTPFLDPLRSSRARSVLSPNIRYADVRLSLARAHPAGSLEDARPYHGPWG